MNDSFEDMGPSEFKIFIYIAFRGPSKPREISKETGIPDGTVRPAVRKLFENGYLTQSRLGFYKVPPPKTRCLLEKIRASVLGDKFEYFYERDS